MASQYNHSAIEKKWRENWEKNPVNPQFDDNGNKKSSKVSFSINNSSQAWKNHKYRLKIKYPSNNIKNNTVIHDCTPYFSRISQILRSPLCVVATIT